MPVSVRPVEGRSDLSRFIKLPKRLRRDDPQWVAPLVFERRAFLNRSKNPNIPSLPPWNSSQRRSIWAVIRPTTSPSRSAMKYLASAWPK